MTPIYEHDCNGCTFLGTYNNHDLYHCTQGGLPTVIARFGNEGEKYKSGTAFADIDNELGEAYKRASDKGLKLTID